MDKSQIRAKVTRWKKYDTERCVYYIPIEGELNIGDRAIAIPIVNPADETHVDSRNPNSEGYGGSRLKFPLGNGEVDEVKGPWHGGSYNFEKDTGIRITDLHYTFVTIATRDMPGFMNYDPDSIVYQDPGWVLGPFMRGERLARQLADIMEIPLYKVSESAGGASAHWVDPGQKMHPMAKRDGDE